MLQAMAAGAVGGFDSVFLADGPAVGQREATPGQRARADRPAHRLAGVTSRIGLIATASRPTTPRTTSPAGSPRSITSAAAGPAGTSSRPRPRRPPRTSVLTTPPVTGSATSARPSSSTCPSGCGTAGKTAPRSATRPRVSTRTRPGSTRWTSPGSTSGCVGRSTSRARRKDGRCSCRPALPRTAASSPPGTLDMREVRSGRSRGPTR